MELSRNVIVFNMKAARVTAYNFATHNVANLYLVDRFIMCLKRTLLCKARGIAHKGGHVVAGSLGKVIIRRMRKLVES